MQAGIGVCLWESVSLSAAADLTLVNECTFLEELLTFGGPNLRVWEHDGRGTEQLGGTIGAAFLAAFQLAGTWHDASPACSLTKIIAAFLERKKIQSYGSQLQGDSLLRHWVRVGACDRAVWQSLALSPRSAQLLQQEQSGWLKVLQRTGWFCLTEMQRFLYSLARGLGHEGPAEHVLMSPLLF